MKISQEEEEEGAFDSSLCSRSGLSAGTCCKSLLRADGDKEHLTLELEAETCSDSLGWVGGKIHEHLSSSVGKANETEEEKDKTSAA